MASITEILPLEILDKIIDILADAKHDGIQYEWDELRDVRACFLTCSRLASRCRRRIYRSVRIFDTTTGYHPSNKSWRPTPSLARSFSDLIADKPEIAGHVRELIYYLQPSTNDNPTPIPFGLRRLKNLHKIILEPESVSNSLSWTTFVSSASGKLIYELMRGPAVASLNLRFVDEFKISDLVGCTHLNHLAVTHLRVCEGIDPLPPPNNVIRIPELTVDFFIKSAANLLKLTYTDGTPVLDRKALKKVNFRFIQDFEVLQDAMEFLKFTTNLEYLGFQALIEHWVQLDVITPGLVQRLLSQQLGRRLTHLFLDLILLPRAMSSSESSELVLKLFQRISRAQTCVEILKVHLNVAGYHRDQLESNMWEALREGMSSLEWPSLTQVELKMSFNGVDTVKGPVTFIQHTPTQCLVEVR